MENVICNLTKANRMYTSTRVKAWHVQDAHTLMHSPLWPTNKWSRHHFCGPGCKGTGELEANNIYQNWKDVSKVISRLKHRMVNRQKRPNKSSVADVALPSWICWVTWYMQLYNSLSLSLFSHTFSSHTENGSCVQRLGLIRELQPKVSWNLKLNKNTQNMSNNEQSSWTSKHRL